MTDVGGPRGGARAPRRLVASLALAVAAAALSTLGLAPTAYAQPQGSFWDEVVSGGVAAWSVAVNRASTAEDRGEIDEALAAWDDAFAIDPSRDEALAGALLLLYHQRPDAFAARLVALRGRQDEVATRPPVLFFAALEATSRGAFDEAIALLEAATRYRSSLAESQIYYGNLAELLMANGAYQDAEFFYRQALSGNSGYAHARAGLALVLEKQGDSDAARQHLLQLFAEDQSLSFLDERGVFMVPDGETELLRALISEATGDAASFETHLAAWAGTPSEQAAPPGMRAMLEARVATADSRTVRFDVPGCVPIRVAASATRDRLAVLCEGVGLREGTVRDGRVTWSTVTGLAFAAQPGTVAYALVDMAYGPDNASLRVLWNSNQAETLNLVTGQSSGLRTFGDTDLHALALTNDGGMVVFTSYMNSGLQVEPWDAAGLSAATSYLSNGTYPYDVRATSDGRRILVVGGMSYQLFSGPTWVYEGDSSIAPDAASPQTVALMDDGEAMVYARGQLVEFRRWNAQAAFDRVLLPAREGAAPRVTSIEPSSDGYVLVGAPNAVYIVAPR